MGNANKGGDVKAFLIDPFAQTVNEVEFDGTLQEMYRLLDCSIVERAAVNMFQDELWVDEEGKLKEKQAYFVYAGYPAPFCNKALLLGESVTHWTEPKASFREVKQRIIFAGPYKGE